MKRILGSLVLAALALAPIQPAWSSDSSSTISFSGTSASLSNSQRNTIQQLVTKNRVVQNLTCSAGLPKAASAAIKNLATKRASTACSFAQKLVPNGIKPKVTAVSGKAGTVSIRVSFSDGPAQEISLDNLDPIWTEEIAWEKVRTYLEQQPKVPLPAQIKYTTNVSALSKLRAQNQLDIAYRFWSKYFAPQGTQIEALFWHDKDVTTAQDTYNTMLRGGVSLNQLADGIIAGKTPYCAHAAALKINTTPETYVFHQCVGSGSTGLAENHTTIHEYTHFIHFNISNKLPIWVTEGSATFYGEALGIYDVDYGRRVLDSHRNALFKSYDLGLGKPASANTLKTLLRQGNSNDVKALFKKLEGPMAQNQADYTSAYILGSFATSALIATFGHEKFVDFMNSFKKSSDYASNFSMAFGLTPDAFYEKLVPYLAKHPSVIF